MPEHAVIFQTNDALTRKKWAKELFRVILPATEFNDLVGTSSDAVIQLRTELGKGEGDTVTFGVRLPFVGEGVVGQDPVEGNEEKLVFKNFKVTIEELNHAVDTGGKMDEQRIPYNLMEEGKSGLQEWWAGKLSTYAFAVLCGDSTFKIASKTFAQAVREPDIMHKMSVNNDSLTADPEASLTAADIMDLTFLDKMKQRAEMMDMLAGATPDVNKTKHYKVRPLMINGKKYYRVILHNYVFDRLRANLNVGQWGDLQRSAQKLDQPNVEFEYNGLLVSKSERIRSLYTNVYRNVLCGAQSAVFAWGGAGDSKSTVMAFVPYTRDAERFVMIRGGGIFGMIETYFEEIDFGKLVGCSYATPLSG